ncbi:MAG: PAS domain S-box protein [Verrucomicrobia bacterium]|nr:PAS domain S-box protein [Verrucomicrobiota bacterium]
MTSLPTLPRRSWLERVSLVLAVGLVVLGVVSILGWVLHYDVLIQPLPNCAALKINNAICVLGLGLSFLGLELGWRRTFLPALVTTLISGLTLIESIFRIDFHIDELLAHDHLLADTAQPGRMAAMSACCLFLASLTLIWRSINRGARARLFAEAVISSIAASAGFSTLLGYATSLPAVYGWGSRTATAPTAALALLLAGAAMLLLAWRETLKTEGGPPAWSPMPAVIGCLTLTIILWIGLRERELAYVGAKTQTSMDTLATTINFELERQATAIERLARMWSDLPTTSEAVWETDASRQLDESSKALGCISLAIVGPNLRTQWIYPPDNSALLQFDHLSDDARRAAIEEARLSHGPAVSGSIDFPGRGRGIDGKKGLAIYSPMVREGKSAGYVAGEYLYPDFFGHIITDHKLAGDYNIVIKIGAERVYDSALATTETRNDDLTLDRAYTIFNRRVRLTFTPTADALTHDRRFLPELALGAGFGITILLGLSVHLARSARNGQRTAELSNKRLQSENEERRRIEARLKVSDERLRLALDSTQIGIFEWNVAARHVYYSPGLWAMMGYEHGRMPSTVEAWQSLIHPDDMPVYRRRVESQLSGIASFIEPEYRVRARSGEWRWVYTRSKTVATGASDRPTRIIGTVQDITARREAEQALRASQAEARKLSLVASKTDNPVLIGSPNGTIEWVNESFSRVMEYSLEEVVGRNPAEFMVGPDTNPRTVVQIRAAMARGQGLSTDVVNYSKSGRKYHLHLEIQPIRNHAGQLENFIAIETDITARVETELTLRRAKAEADDASRAKSEFLASMSHEIRTPMNGVIGMTSLLMETPLNTEQRDFVNTIRTSGEALLTIINDILDFSKIESGKMELERMPFDLNTCIEEALDLFALQTSAKKLELVSHIEPDVPPWIVGDVTRLRQVIVNLVNNSVKFTPSGSVAIEVRRVPVPVGTHSDSHRFMLEFAIRDTGIGIPADRLDRLFKAFSQVDSSTTRKFGGTGLGLAISQRLTKLMNGDIRVESSLGHGSSFIFTIETEAAAQASASNPPIAVGHLRQATVLCVEDHPVTQKHLRALLDPLGAECLFAANAAEAQGIAAALDQPPALLIISDDETGGSSTLDALVGIKSPRMVLLPFGQNAPPAPADGLPFVTVFKPVKVSAFTHAIQVLFAPHLSARPAAANRISDRPLAEDYPLDVLLAEDNAVNQKVALRFLERLGYRADAVGNGLEALTTLENRRYDLVLMDLQMPEMDGLEASRQIRRRLPASRQPKIVALTANAMQGDRELCLAAGMDDYISKPVKLHEIESTIRRLFAKSGASVPPV